MEVKVRALLGTEDPDATVLEKIRGGDTSYYQVLIRRYNQRLYRVAQALLHDETAVEDVMQEAYLKAFTGLSGFQGRSLFSTWLTRILINCALAHIRTRSRRAEVALDLVEHTEAAEGARRADESAGDLRIAQEQIGRLIERTIDALPAPYRVVFVMRELEGMSVAETASSLGITTASTKVRLHRAKRLMRDELRRQMPDITLYGFLGNRCDAMTRRVMDRIALLSREPPPGLPDTEVIDKLGADMRAGEEDDESGA